MEQDYQGTATGCCIYTVAVLRNGVVQRLELVLVAAMVRQLDSLEMVRCCVTVRSLGV